MVKKKPARKKKVEKTKIKTITKRDLQRMARKLEDEGSKLAPYVSLSVDWVKLVEDNQRVESRLGHNEEDENYIEILRYLQAKDILTSEGRLGSYFVAGAGGADLSPSIYGELLHFSRLRDAVSYGRAKFGKHKIFRICENVARLEELV
jgi:hypothetical protein